MIHIIASYYYNEQWFYFFDYSILLIFNYQL